MPVKQYISASINQSPIIPPADSLYYSVFGNIYSGNSEFTVKHLELLKLYTDIYHRNGTRAPIIEMHGAEPAPLS